MDGSNAFNAHCSYFKTLLVQHNIQGAGAADHQGWLVEDDAHSIQAQHKGFDLFQGGETICC